MSPSRLAVLMIVALLTAPLLAGEVEVRRSAGKRGMVDVSANGAELQQVVSALQLHLDRPVSIVAPQRIVTVALREVEPLAALEHIARTAKLSLRTTRDGHLLSDPREPAMTLDVKDATLKELVAEVKKQCGYRNVVVDPGVDGTGTFLFHEVPCRTAMQVIFGTLSLTARVEPNSVLHISQRK